MNVHSNPVEAAFMWCLGGAALYAPALKARSITIKVSRADLLEPAFRKPCARLSCTQCRTMTGDLLHAMAEILTMTVHAHEGPVLSLEDTERFGADPVRTFTTNLSAVENRIADACSRAGRDRASVRLLPITKTVPAHILRFAHTAGIRSFGENKIQEAMSKHEALNDLSVDWSIVGHLQTNKIKYLTRFAREFHGLDSLRLARLLNKHLEQEDRSLDVYVQVNTSGEESKYGLHPDALLPFAEMLDQFPRLRPRGLMTLALFSSDMDKVRPCFRLLRRLRDTAARRNAALTELSMGMSGDFEEAVEEGADVVRVGQAIFGNRPTPDSYYWPGLTGTI